MGQNPMAGCGGGMALSWLVILLLLVVVGYLAYRWGQSQTTDGGIDLGRRDGRREHYGSGEALELARRRYAQGDITREEFEQLKRDLQGPA